MWLSMKSQAATPHSSNTERPQGQAFSSRIPGINSAHLPSGRKPKADMRECIQRQLIKHSGSMSLVSIVNCMAAIGPGAGMAESCGVAVMNFTRMDVSTSMLFLRAHRTTSTPSCPAISGTNGGSKNSDAIKLNAHDPRQTSLAM